MDPVSFALAVMPAGAPAPRRSLPGRDDPAVAPFLVHPARPPRGPRAATGVPALDALLDGGFPAGQISELVGAWIGMGADIAVRAILVTIRHTRGRWVETAV